MSQPLSGHVPDLAGAVHTGSRRPRVHLEPVRLEASGEREGGARVWRAEKGKKKKKKKERRTSGFAWYGCVGLCALACVGEIAQRLAEGLDLRGKLQIRKEQGGGGWWRC